ncbi:MAG: DNA-3-methyladenine glycosylase [Phycisphaerales bacterium]
MTARSGVSAGAHAAASSAGHSPTGTVGPRGSPARFSPRDYAVDPVTLAQRLLGCVLVHRLVDGTLLSGRIVETEAYLGVRDRCSHSFGGRRTPRVEPMYGPPGTAYVYFTYGMHNCMNVVCGREGEPVAVLLRALEPIEGIEFMRQRRVTHATRNGQRRARLGKPPRDEHLCRGPASLCRAMGIELAHSGVLMTGAASPLWVERGELTRAERRSIENTARIGLGHDAPRWVKRRLRWFVSASRSVTRTAGGEISSRRSTR